MAIKIGGTSVINDSRQLQNIASVDAATVTALDNAGVGGGTIGFNTTNFSSTSSFTKPNTGYNVYENFFGNALNTLTNGVPSSSYEIIVGTAITSETLAMLSYAISGASTHSQRGNYWGDVLLVGKKNTVTNKSMAFANMAKGWTNQTTFPVSFTSGVLIMDTNDRLCIWGSDAYTGGGQFNSNLVLASGAATMQLKALTIT